MTGSGSGGGTGNGDGMVGVALTRIVIREGSEQQYIFLRERDGERGFPIVIGTAEACEIRRVAAGIETPRPLTHQLAYDSIKALGAELRGIDIVDLRENTFFARLRLRDGSGEVKEIDARPSDAVALALRAGCPIRVAQSVLDTLQTETPQEPEADEPEDEPQGGPEEEPE